MIDYGNIVEPDSFVGRYMRYMDNQETATSYDFWCAMWLMSVAFGRDVIIARPKAAVHMNWYVVLTAESGVTRKSSAVKVAKQFAYSIRDSDSRFYEVIETKTTPEMFEQMLKQLSLEHGHATVAIAISELVTFLGRERYTRQMPGLLTDLYDSPHLRRGGGTITHGRTHIQNVYVSFLSASTPSWLLRAINPDVVEGGFTSRVIFVRSEQPKRKIPWPEQRVDEDQQRLQVLRSLLHLRGEARSMAELRMSRDGLATFAGWYDGRVPSREPFSASFESREDAHILRLAGMLAINRGSDTLEERDISPAISIIQHVKADGANLFVGGATSSEFVLALDRLRERLLKAGEAGVKQRDLLYGLLTHGFDTKYYRTALAIMHELHMVQKFEVKPQGRGKVATVWRAREALRDQRAVEAVLDEMAPGG